MAQRLLVRSAAGSAALLAAWVTLAGLASTGCGEPEAPESAPASEAPFAWPDGPRPMATIALAGRGEIHIALYPELAPKTVKNFIALAAVMESASASDAAKGFSMMM